MTSLKLESWDDSLWDVRGNPYGPPLVSATYGQNGNGMALGDGVNGGSSWTWGHNGTDEFYMGFAINIQSEHTGTVAIFGLNYTYSRFLWAGGSNQFQLYVRGSATADINWYSSPVSEDEWHYLEFRLKSGTSSNGTVGFWMDGTLINQTTTHDFYQAMGSTVGFGGTTSSYVNTMWMDNFYFYYVNDTDFTPGPLGPIEVVSLVPNGNGNSSDLVGSDGNSTDNYLLVDEDPPDEGTTYVGGATEGDHDTYAMENLTGTPTVVGAVATMVGAKTASGPKFLRHKCRSNSVDYNGDSIGLATDYSMLAEYAWEHDPNTSAAWTYTAINSAEFGAEVRDS